MAEEFKNYKIEPRGFGGEKVAVFQLRHARPELTERPGIPNWRTEVVLDEKSLASRVANLDKGGYDATLSRSALSALRAAKAKPHTHG